MKAGARWLRRLRTKRRAAKWAACPSSIPSRMAYYTLYGLDVPRPSDLELYEFEEERRTRRSQHGR